MKMKDYAEFLDQQQREADTELLIQYKKELKDLEELDKDDSITEPKENKVESKLVTEDSEEEALEDFKDDIEDEEYSDELEDYDDESDEFGDDDFDDVDYQDDEEEAL